jgi:hypothetical protein
MPRPYHSPSSIKLAQRCEHAWAECYINGRRSPGTPATELGTAMHTVGEDWYEGRKPAWHTLPGQIFQSGAHLLPHPTRCADALVELPIGDVPIDNPNADGPQTVLEIDGVRWAGFRDLVAIPLDEEADRLGLPRGRASVLDYKSCANIARYALTEAELAADLQCNLYAYATATDWQRDRAFARWVYFETKKVRRAKAVDVIIARDAALEIIAPCNALARQLDTLVDVGAAVKNPLACNDFGRVCEHHKSQPGGTCDARRSIGGLIQARVRKAETTMALKPEVAAKMAALRAKAAGAAEAPADETETPDDGRDEGDGESETGEAPDTTAAAAPKPKLGVGKPTPAKPAAPVAPGAKPSKLAALVAKYEAKQAELAALGAEIAAAVQ